MQNLKRLRLREIVQVDGRQSPMTAFSAWSTGKHKTKLGAEDCVLFINKTRTFLRFITGITKVHQEGQDFNVLVTFELRLENGEWNPLKLVDFAQSVGLDLVNLKSFKEHFEAEQERRKEHKVEMQYLKAG